jgi:hypothetical protein
MAPIRGTERRRFPDCKLNHIPGSTTNKPLGGASVVVDAGAVVAEMSCPSRAGMLDHVLHRLERRPPRPLRASAEGEPERDGWRIGTFTTTRTCRPHRQHLTTGTHPPRNILRSGEEPWEDVFQGTGVGGGG